MRKPFVCEATDEAAKRCIGLCVVEDVNKLGRDVLFMINLHKW
jgi:hypothetical protein